MKHPLRTILTCLLLSSNWGFAQDIHWSQFNENPLFQNPGNTGDFNGDYRFVGNYRSQWKSVTIPFETVALSAEKNFNTLDNRSLGMQFFHDVVGDGEFRTTELLLSGALNKVLIDSTWNFRPGVTLGFNSRRFDPSNFYFDNQYSGLGFDPSLPSGEIFQTDQKFNLTFSTGIKVSKQLNATNSISGGIALFNINRPNQGFFGAKTKRDRRIMVHSKYHHQLTNELILLPSLQWNAQGKYREFIAGSNVRYLLENRMGNYKTIQAGLWYRFRDAAYLTVGAEWQDLFVGVSYDINISRLTPASGGRGGIEFAVRYILRTFKSDKSIHRICPEFI